MNLLTIAYLALFAGLGASSTVEPRQAQDVTITWWREPNCKGDPKSHTLVKDSPGHELWTLKARSFKVSTKLRPHEQLDLSRARDVNNFDRYSHDSSCAVWQRTYFSRDLSTNCQNVETFTCFKLWRNEGLVKTTKLDMDG
ncbi:hypothetical protein BJX70DRAFT_87972 [Aspergillus crustosus]